MEENQGKNESPTPRTWTRKSKPKVKTGCITWLRKVKCDEQKPACRKCTATGRVCEGYSAPVRICIPLPCSGSKFHANSLADEFNPQPNCPRQISSGISGTNDDRRFFQIFRTATEVSTALHVCDFISFWSRVAPQLGHHEDTIKHALVALGATYHFNKTTGGTGLGKQDPFILRRYSKSICELQHRIASQDPESACIALICCLIFICLENLRFNHQNARAHLRNGIQIIESTVDLQHLYCLPEQHATERRNPIKASLLSDTELRGLVNYFRHAEICERLYSHDAPLSLASRLRAKKTFDDGRTTLPEHFNTLAEGYEARVELNNDVMALDWELSNQRCVAAIWSHPRIQHEHECLRERAILISEKYLAFLAGENAPVVGSREYASACLDMVTIKSMQAVLELMPARSINDIDFRNTPFFHETIIGGMIHFAELLHDAVTVGRHEILSTLDLTVQTSILGPTYLVYVYSTDHRYKSKARRILVETKSREQQWDSRSLKTIVEMSKSPNQHDESRGSAFMALGRWSSGHDYYGLYSRNSNVTESTMV